MIAGILLAAGCARRFGSHKLLYQLSDGTPIALASARHLRHGVGYLRAVVRADDCELIRLLHADGIATVVCEQAERGMGASLAAGVRAEPGAQSWMIALADMPWIEPKTIRDVAELLRQGAEVAAPFYTGRRGHPVGFARKFRRALLSLTSDRGARDLLERHAGMLQGFHCDDAGVLRDVDVPGDLSRDNRRNP